MPDVAGPALFARYAYPPNRHGYCGPEDHETFFAHGVSPMMDGRGLRSLSRQFNGAWPYLELIAGATGLDDPLDRRVVEAYWIGSPRLEQVGARAMGNLVEERFRGMAGKHFWSMADDILAGCVPHHSFAVFCIYPWTALLSDGGKAGQALDVLDRCRIRWGKVLAIQGDEVVVEYSPLTWDGRTLALGPLQTETAVRSVDGVSMIDGLAVGRWVSLHWDWVCDKLTEPQARYLRDFTVKHLNIVNTGRHATTTLLGA